MSSWICYQHVMIPTCAPHEEPDLSPVQDGTIFRENKTALLARWTTNFDCGYETDFWYVVKDTPFAISALKAKRRYEITKGVSNFDVHLIKPVDYAEALVDVMVDAYTAYPPSYRPRNDRNGWMREIFNWGEHVYGAFNRESGELCGFALIAVCESYALLAMLKSRPQSERLHVNAAIIDAVMNDFHEKLKSGYYICNGTRNVSHESNFDEYLSKYFGFRRAYCWLHIMYRWPINWIVGALYPLRNFIRGDGRLSHKVKAVLRMEEMRRNCMKCIG